MGLQPRPEERSRSRKARVCVWPLSNQASPCSPAGPFSSKMASDALQSPRAGSLRQVAATITAWLGSLGAERDEAAIATVGYWETP